MTLPQQAVGRVVAVAVEAFHRVAAAAPALPGDVAFEGVSPANVRLLVHLLL